MKLRILFAVIIILLFVQFIFAVKVSEPYPAIIYPSFGKAPSNSQYNSYRTIEIIIGFKNGEIVIDNKLFNYFNPSARRSILERYFISQNSRKIESIKMNNFKESTKKEIIKFYNKEPEYVEIKWYITREYFREHPVKIVRNKYKQGNIRF